MRGTPSLEPCAVFKEGSNPRVTPFLSNNIADLEIKIVEYEGYFDFFPSKLSLWSPKLVLNVEAYSLLPKYAIFDDFSILRVTSFYQNTAVYPPQL